MSNRAVLIFIIPAGQPITRLSGAGGIVKLCHPSQRGNAPLLISRHVPLMYSGHSVASQTIAFAISSGFANLFKYTMFLIAVFLSSGITFSISVSTGPAATELITIPFGPRIFAKLLVALISPALVIPYQTSG